VGVITANATDRNPFRFREIRRTPEFDRIFSIPRREWSEEDADQLRFELTDIMKKPEGEQILRPIQGISLCELGMQRGLISTATMGAGKTLIGLMASYMLEATRTLWLVPADLKEKTFRDRDAYVKHWDGIPSVDTGHYEGYFMRVETYDLLGGKRHLDLIEKIRPKLIVCDEAHRIKNTGAAVTKRVRRWMERCPDTALVLMSGTMVSQSLREIWHLLKWTLPADNVPLPMPYGEMDEWASAIDLKAKAHKRVRPGALLEFATEEEKQIARTQNFKKASRLIWQRRFVETPGIVATTNTYDGASLKIKPYSVDPPDDLKAAIVRLKRNKVTEDGWTCPDASRIAGHVRELSQGFYYVWTPRPPDIWRDRRKAWHQACRHAIRYTKHRLDTGEQVYDAVLAGVLGQEYRNILDDWLEIKSEYDIKKKAVWLSDFALDAAAAWAKKNVGVIWVQHPSFGKKLAERTGLRFYHSKGFDKDGNFIEDHPKGETVIASIKANMAGKNLQYKWSKALIMHCPSSGAWLEQLIGRFHREGQEADEVEIHIFISCSEQVRAYYDARDAAEMMQDTMRQEQKLLVADNLMPSLDDIEKRHEEWWDLIELSEENVSMPSPSKVVT